MKVGLKCSLAGFFFFSSGGERPYLAVIGDAEGADSLSYVLLTQVQFFFLYSPFSLCFVYDHRFIF